MLTARCSQSCVGELQRPKGRPCDGRGRPFIRQPLPPRRGDPRSLTNESVSLLHLRKRFRAAFHVRRDGSIRRGRQMGSGRGGGERTKALMPFAPVCSSELPSPAFSRFAQALPSIPACDALASAPLHPFAPPLRVCSALVHPFVAKGAHPSWSGPRYESASEPL